MTDDDKLLVESLRGGETTALGRGYAADRIEALTAENERLREALESVLAHRYGEWCDIARAALGDTQ